MTVRKVKKPSSVIERIPMCGEMVVRAAGLEPAQGFRPYGFSYHFGFRRRLTQGVCGLDYPFTLASPR